jgi:hypothetical protein
MTALTANTVTTRPAVLRWCSYGDSIGRVYLRFDPKGTSPRILASEACSIIAAIVEAAEPKPEVASTESQSR